MASKKIKAATGAPILIAISDGKDDEGGLLLLGRAMPKNNNNNNNNNKNSMCNKLNNLSN